MVPHCPLLQCPPVPHRADLSTPALSTLATPCRYVHSCIVHSRKFSVPLSLKNCCMLYTIWWNFAQFHWVCRWFTFIASSRVSISMYVVAVCWEKFSIRTVVITLIVGLSLFQKFLFPVYVFSVVFVSHTSCYITLLPIRPRNGFRILECSIRYCKQFLLATLYTVSGKKGTSSFLGITLTNTKT